VFHAEAAAELSKRRIKAGLPEAAAQQDAEEDGRPAEQQVAAEADVLLDMPARAPALPGGTQQQAAQQGPTALSAQQARPPQAAAAALPGGTQLYDATALPGGTQLHAATVLPAGTQQQAAQQGPTALSDQQAQPPQAAAAALPAGTQLHAAIVLPAGTQQQAAQQAHTALSAQQARPPQAAAAALAAGTQQHTTQEAHEALRACVALAVARGRLPLQPCGSWASGNTGPAAPTGSDDEDCDTMPTRKCARVV
jgi:hypothetical protein